MRYLDFWPLLRQAWPTIAGLEPILLLVAEPEQVPASLQDEPAVRVFSPVEGIPTAFQAQCIRLLFPAVLDIDGGVVTADADIVPMNRSYLHRPASRIDADHFLAYRDVLLANGEIPICYNAARPETWRAVFRVESTDDVRTRLAEWFADAEYAGVHGGSGWGADQQILYRTLLDYARRTRTVWILDDHFTGFRRLERARLYKGRRLEEADDRLIRRGRYSDFHCLVPYLEFAEVNNRAVELASDSARQRRERQRRRWKASAAKLDPAE